MSTFYFPFGQPLTKVQQSDKTPKSVFVLGVYASAVHAKWIDNKGKQVVKALAVEVSLIFFGLVTELNKLLLQLKSRKN